jgi:hydroxyacylglutathione hydrolase
MIAQPPVDPAPSEPLAVWLIPVLRDNYVVVLQRGRRAAVVDPAVAEPVALALEERGLELEAILHTHHHSDHIGGTPGLLRRWPAAAVVAAAADRQRIPFQTMGVGDGERFTVLDEPVEVLAVPGHTRAHLAFWLPASGHLFCGDTLFVGGCGRLFEGTSEQMHASLQRLAALPEATLVWCAHEYTETNFHWAATIAPDDARSRPGWLRCGQRGRRASPRCRAASAWSGAPTCFCGQRAPATWPGCATARTSGERSGAMGHKLCADPSAPVWLPLPFQRR